MAVKPLSINFSTGIIRWERGSADRNEISVQQPLSPFYLHRLAEVDKAAEQARKGFRSLEDLSAAEASRNRQIIVRPDSREETDVSKEAGKLLRQLDREERRTERKKRREFQPVMNMATGRIKWS